VRPTLSRLFEEHAKFVGRSLLCLGIPDSDLDDAVQEVFMIVARRLDDYEERGAVRSWLWAIALYVSRGWSRRPGAREHATGVLPELVEAASLDESIDRRRAAQRALAALDTLSREQREVFVLYEIEEMAMREVAEAVRCPLQTAYYRLHTARAKLREAGAKKS
jgi:RNA polymerase sigma-70 factor (ECF subfamily)